ncbi:MAG: sn-glycerol-3-phosphate ABC transporter ATP-binding protein UgpC [bacterium]
MARVVLEQVTKVFEGGVVAARDISFTAEEGEFVVLVGPSGCGKSTVLRMIAGLETVTQGRIFIGERVVNDVAPKDRDIAMVFQNYALYPHLSVYENMAFGLQMRRFPKAEIESRVHAAAEILELADFLKRKPKALSGGQRQRVALGRAIVRHPQVFLFDEPLSNLDAKLRVQMRTELAKLHQRLGATMIYVTHDQVEAMTMGNRIVVLKDGVVQQVDTPMNLYQHPANRFVGGFIGSPAMNFFTCDVQDGILKFAGKETPVTPELRQRLGERQQIILGIRPEHFTAASDAAASAVRIEPQMEVVEPMGSEIYLHFSLKGLPGVARLPAETVAHPGKPFGLAFDLARCHFFDSESERAL